LAHPHRVALKPKPLNPQITEGVIVATTFVQLLTSLVVSLSPLVVWVTLGSPGDPLYSSHAYPPSPLRHKVTTT
jgi:hypothetical protein